MKGEGFPHCACGRKLYTEFRDIGKCGRCLKGQRPRTGRRIKGKPFDDLTGRTFGRLNVLEFITTGDGIDGGQSFYQTKCLQCGRVEIKRRALVLMGRCKCAWMTDLTGREYGGNFHVLSRCGSRPSISRGRTVTHATWHVECRRCEDRFVRTTPQIKLETNIRHPCLEGWRRKRKPASQRGRKEEKHGN